MGGARGQGHAIDRSNGQWLPSASVSFANGLRVTGVLNAVLYVSSLATGGVWVLLKR
ncbi:hypothetical protein NK318_11060 [Acinetobacter junii]